MLVENGDDSIPRFSQFAGVENEGWFDPWSLLKAFKEKALSLGARYINGEVTGFGVKKVPAASADMAYYTGSGRRVQSVKVGAAQGPHSDSSRK